MRGLFRARGRAWRPRLHGTPRPRHRVLPSRARPAFARQGRGSGGVAHLRSGGRCSLRSGESGWSGRQVGDSNRWRHLESI